MCDPGSPSYMQYETGKEVFLANKFDIHFIGNVYFENNNGSAIYLTSSILEFSQRVNTIFINNSGSESGAMAMIGSLQFMCKNTPHSSL